MNCPYSRAARRAALGSTGLPALHWTAARAGLGWAGPCGRVPDPGPVRSGGRRVGKATARTARTAPWPVAARAPGPVRVRCSRRPVSASSARPALPAPRAPRAAQSAKPGEVQRSQHSDMDTRPDRYSGMEPGYPKHLHTKKRAGSSPCSLYSLQLHSSSLHCPRFKKTFLVPYEFAACLRPSSSRQTAHLKAGRELTSTTAARWFRTVTLRIGHVSPLLYT